MSVLRFMVRLSGFATFCNAIAIVAFLALSTSFLMAQENGAGNDAFSIENELLLDVQLAGRSLGATVLAYQKNGKIFVALEEFMEIIEFPIRTDASAGQAGGWFIDEEREFLLDLQQNLVISDADEFKPEGEALVFQEEIFVSLQALERWFPLDVEPQIRKLALEIDARERLPIERTLARRSGRVFGVGAIGNDPVLPLQETPYTVLGPVVSDIRLSTSSSLQDENSSTSLSGNYSVLSRGDLAWMTSTLALSGNDQDGISSGRFKLERGLDKPFLSLDHIEIGDVDTGSRGVLVRGGGAEEGAQGTFADDFIDLRGDIPPGWEAELYRNGVLIDAQIVGDDAQYEFLQVPLEFGENIFEFVFYGPYGEERRDQRIVYAGEQLDFGEVSYSFSAVEDGRSVFDEFQSSPKGKVGSARFLAGFDFGLGGPFSARVNVDSFKQEENRLQDYGVGLSATFDGIQTSVGYNSNARGYDSVSGLVKGRFGRSASASIRYSEFLDDDVDPEFRPRNRNLRSLVGNLSTRVFDVPVSFRASRTERELTSDSSASLGATVRNRLGRLSKSLFYARSNDEGSVEEVSGGSIRFAFDHRPWNFRLGSSYGLSPEPEIVDVNSSASIRLDRTMSANFDISHRLENDYSNYRIGLNWGLEHLSISPQVIYDSNGRWLGLVSVSLSINSGYDGRSPVVTSASQTSHGAVLGSVFMDENGDGLRGENEIGLPDVRVDAPQAFKTATTGRGGKANLVRLPAEQVTDIAIDVDSLPELGLISTSPGVSVKPRPGSWSRVDFPIIRTMELEGYVLKHSPSTSGPEPMPRVVVKLIDQDGELISRQRTVFDGFFLFSNVPPGNYRLVLDGQFENRIIEKPEEVIVTSSGGVIRNLNFQIGSGESFSPEAATALPSLRNAPGLDDNSPSNDDPEEGLARPFEAVSDQELPQPEIDVAKKPQSNQKSGNWHVQFGAFSDQQNAALRWQQLQNIGVLREGQAPRYQSSGGLLRLLTDEGLSEAEARSLCNRVKARGAGDCLVRELGN